MKRLAAFLATSLLLGCASSSPRVEQQSADSTQAAAPPVISPPAPPAAIAENRSLMGSVIREITLIDEFRYTVTLDVRTALPSGNTVSMLEPGQTIVAVPEYETGADGGIALDLPRNRRLHAVRSSKAGDALLGTVTLRDDGSWHILDTGF